MLDQNAPQPIDHSPPPAGTATPGSPPPDQWQTNVSITYRAAQYRWASAQRLFEHSLRAAAGDDEAVKKRRIAYYREIELTAQELLGAVEAAVDAGAVQGRLNELVLQIREALAWKYVTCEKYDRAEEQFRRALRGWQDSPPDLNDKEKAEWMRDRQRACRRGQAMMLCRGATAKADPQKARLEALQLVMENVNGGLHRSLPEDIKCCEDIVFRLVDATYPPPGSDEDCYEVCEAHVATLETASTQLHTSAKRPEAELGVFLLRIEVRILELLVEDLGDLDSAEAVYDSLKTTEPSSYTEKLTGDRYKKLVARLLKDADKLGARVARRRRSEQLWSTALQAATSQRSSLLRAAEEASQNEPRPALQRSYTAGTEASEFGTEENGAHNDEYGDTWDDGMYGVVLDAQQRKHWHEKWLNSMKQFAAVTLRNAPAIGPNLAVRLTVIDTGLHAAHPRLADRDWSGRFVDFSKSGPPAEGEPGQLSDPAQAGNGTDKPVDEDGHGTFIAGLLLDIVPNLDLYVARVGTTREDMAMDEHIGYKIGKAIKHAVTTWNTEIISISVGCDGDKDARSALREAIFKDVVVLAAPGNAGNSRVTLFPANEDRVFKIYSASPLAKPDEISVTPTDPKFSFYTLGRDIRSIWPGQLIHRLGPDVASRCKTKEREEKRRARKNKARASTPGNKQDEEGAEVAHVCSETCDTYAIMSGTSYATPIAAAMVAVVYQFYNSFKTDIDKHRRKGTEELKSINSVRHILARMGSSRPALTAGGWDSIVFLQAPSYRTGSYFHFEPCNPSGQGGARTAGQFAFSEGDRDEWNHTYDEFFWKRLVEVINDARRSGNA